MSEALDLLSRLVCDGGTRWAESAADFQIADARAVLDPSSPVRRFWISRSKGGRKTSDAAAMTIAAMRHLLPRGSKAYCAARDEKQAGLLHDSLRSFIAATPHLPGTFDITAGRVVDLVTGVELEVLSSDKSSAHGLRPAWLVLDETCWWPDTPATQEFYEALTANCAKMPNSRLIVISTNGSIGHWASRLYELAAKDRAWRLSEVRGPMKWIDPEEIEAERRSMSASMFQRLWMNEWSQGEDSLGDLEAIKACAVLDGAQAARQGVDYIAGVDIGIKKNRTAISVCHREASDIHWDGADRIERGWKIVVDRTKTFQGSKLFPVKLSEVEDYLEQIDFTFGGPRVLFDPWNATGLMQRLVAKGVRCEEFPFSSGNAGKIARDLHLLIRERNLEIADDEDLIGELAATTLIETTPGNFKMGKSPGKNNDLAIAVGIASHALLQEPPEEQMKLVNVAVGDPRHRKYRSVWVSRQKRFSTDEQQEAWEMLQELRGTQGGDSRLRGRR